MLEKIQIFIFNIRCIIINVFIMLIVFYSTYYWVKNYYLKNKYKITNKNFEVSCCLEDGSEKDRDKIYLINKRKKTSQWIGRTAFNEIFKFQGFKAPSRKDKYCFSELEYKKGQKIEFDENTISIINLLSILK